MQLMSIVENNITFGIIVLNGEPYTIYNLRSIYSYAFQIIVVEGACKAASSVANNKGHSTDGTLEVLRKFQMEEDYDKKVIIVTAEDEGYPDGFWPGEKHEMSQAYAKRAKGNYLWQVDIDEFYREEDMEKILLLLREKVDVIQFPTLNFWGSISTIEDGENRQVNASRYYYRLFRWGPGYQYKTHRPPTVIDAEGIDLCKKNCFPVKYMDERNIYLYHYSMLLPKQVLEKCSYYSKVDWASLDNLEEWVKEVYIDLKNPFKVYKCKNVSLSWLEEYNGSHPKQIYKMIDNINGGMHLGITLRKTNDLINLVRSPKYRIGRVIRKTWVKILYVNKKYGLKLNIIRYIKNVFQRIINTYKTNNIEKKRI